MAEGRWRRCPEVAVVDRGSRVVVLPLADPSAGRPLVLEGPAAAVWHALDEPGTSREVAGRVADAVGVPAAEVEADVAGFLLRLAAVRVVEPPLDDTDVTPATTSS
ncbi:MAG TPA: PqqD family protein [Pedococcus sp.]|nr:PqqD family protein [Pedococcus sp.]